MEVSQVTQLLTDFALLGGQAVTFAGGGEPTAHPDLVSIIAFAYAMGLDCGLITNGHYLSEDQAEAFTSLCKWIRVSLDGTESTYKSRHGAKADWSRTYCNLCALADCNRPNCKVGVSYLLSSTTCHDAYCAAQLVESAGADYIQFKPFDGDNYDPSLLLDGIRAKLPDFQVYGFFQRESSATRSYDKCHAAHFIVDVAANGDVNKCCAWRAMRKKSLGNVNDSGLENVLRSELFGEAANSSCADCPSWCRNHAMNEAIQYFCKEPMEHNNFV
jgi:MoaA/NifB/PqqE/SkfB family radical SAM enzyme